MRGSAEYRAVVALAVLLSASDGLAQYGQFDATATRPADEAIVKTPPGFRVPGRLETAKGPGLARLSVVVRVAGERAPTPCRVAVVGADGNFYRPKDDRLAPYRLGGHWPKEGLGNRPGKAPIRYFGGFFYTTGAFEVDVPPGPVRIDAWKGMERPSSSWTGTLGHGTTKSIELSLSPAAGLASEGWYSGDPHLHFPRGGPEDDSVIFDLLDAEDVRFGGILCYNDDTSQYHGTMDRQASPQTAGLGRASEKARGDRRIVSGQEYRSKDYGHLLCFGRDRLVRENESLDPNAWPVFGVVGKETKARGGKAIHAHGGYSQEIYADVAHGAVDGVELFQFGIYRGIGRKGWYSILSAGYAFAAVGASDYPACRKLCDCVTYCRLEGPFTADAWLDAAARGRSFVTSGPLLLLDVDGRGPGERLQLEEPPPRRVLSKVRLMSPAAPVTHLEWIVNGKVVRRERIEPVSARTQWREWEETIELDRSSWIAARAYSLASTGSPDADAHTNPVTVTFRDRLPFDPSAVDFLLERVDEAIDYHEKRSFAQKERALDYFRKARALFAERRAEGPPPLAARLPAVPLEPIPPKSPSEALRSIETLPGLKVELVADDRLVHDPVAGAFDADGRLYVAEMIDYPFHPPVGSAPLGKVRRLEDRDGDGRFDQSTVYADKLLWVAGIACHEDGVYVAAAPNIWYFKDTTGDGIADVREVVFSGFGTKNQQAMVNNLIWGLDGKIYGATAHNAGEVRRGADAAGPAISVRGADFRFDPRRRTFELESGTAQFGNAFDDAYRRFVCSESKPAYHVLLPRAYLSRNPFFAPPPLLVDLAPGTTPVFRSSPIEGWRRIRTERRMLAAERPEGAAGANHDVLDGGAGVTIYRGDALPKEFRGCLFVCDAQNNLVHRRRLLPDGVTFRSEPADAGREFLRSSDNWFRPVNLLHGPDGALYVLDMSREIIESIHIPSDVFARLDLTRGRDQGRIYRVAPEGFRPPPPPRLSKASTAALVEALGHRNAWHRETAQRLLLERRDPSAVEPLKALVKTNAWETARLHAYAALEALGGMDEGSVKQALCDPSPIVREHAVRWAEARLRDLPNLRLAIAYMAEDPDVRVRFQTAFSLGEWQDPVSLWGLAWIARRDGADPWVRAAILSSAAGRAEALGRAVLREGPGNGGLVVFSALGEIVGARGEPGEIDRWIELCPSSPAACEEGLAALARGVARSNRPLRPEQSPVVAKFARSALETLSGGTGASALAAVDRLAILDGPEIRSALLHRLDAPAPEDLRLALIRSLSRRPTPETIRSLLGRWNSFSPALKQELAGALLSRGDSSLALLEAVAAGEIPRAEILPRERGRLRSHPDPEVRARFSLVFKEESQARVEVERRYAAALTRKGDAEAGKKVFTRVCANCHRVGGIGREVGPNLATSRFRTAEALLPHVLDPNLEVQPNYVAHAVSLADGRTLVGLLASETTAAVTLKVEEGKTESILKSQIESMTSTGRSLMPEGVEKDVSVEQMADLLAYLSAVRYDIGSEPGAPPPR